MKSRKNTERKLIMDKTIISSFVGSAVRGIKEVSSVPKSYTNGLLRADDVAHLKAIKSAQIADVIKLFKQADTEDALKEAIETYKSATAMGKGDKARIKRAEENEKEIAKIKEFVTALPKGMTFIDTRICDLLSNTGYFTDKDGYGYFPVNKLEACLQELESKGVIKRYFAERKATGAKVKVFEIC